MNQPLDPNEFIIARKRKKYKFAKFANAPNCFEYDEWRRRSVDVLEIGAGTARFSLEQAMLRPERHHVAVDVKADRLQNGAYEALDRGIGNLNFVRARADQIEELFSAGSITSLWLTFPDPFGRPRSARRRLTHPIYLARYARLLAEAGRLYLKHDDTSFFQWSLEQLAAEGWVIEALSFDLHHSNLPEEYKILTTYEQRWLGEGRVTNFVRARPPVEPRKIT